MNKQSVRIPSLPTDISHLMRILMDDEIPFTELARELESFPTIAARLLSLANSAWAVATTPVISLEDACKKLGFNVVRSTSIALAVSSPFDPSRCPAFDAGRFWFDALCVAETASFLAAEVDTDGEVQLPMMRMSGLLHSLGLLWLVDTMPKETGNALILAQQSGEHSLNRLTEKLCNMSYSQATGALFTAWQLPSELIRVVTEYPDPDYSGDLWQQARLLLLSRQLVKSLPLGDESINSEDFSIPPVMDFNQVLSFRSRLDTRTRRLEKLAEVLF